MLIILEGPDGSGKSTLAKQFEDAGYTKIYQPRGTAFSFEKMLLLSNSTDVVFDRWGVTTWVYRLLDNEPLDRIDFSMREMHMVFNNSIIVYCTNKDAFENSIARGETNVTTKEKAIKLRQLYDFVIGTIRLYEMADVIEYDFAKNTFKELTEKINKLQRR